MAKASTTMKTASVLAFERKLANSDALMWAGNWQDRENEQAWQPVALQEKAVRGTISNRLKKGADKDPAKLDAEIQNANLQRVDVATLPFDCDTLKIRFSLRVLGDVPEPTACNQPDYLAVLKTNMQSYIETFQFRELAARYAENLANGRFLWRNRVGAGAVEVRVSHVENQSVKASWVFDALSFNLRAFSTPNKDLAALSEVIRQGLLGNTTPLLEVEAWVRLGTGQEVFPSQELVLDQSGNKSGKKSKYLYQVDGCAAMHSQKVGNALRTVDTWHPQAETLGPIAVEPYGSVTSRGVACRKPADKMDFYNLFDGWMLKDKVPDEAQQHYIAAILIRGGVFGSAD